MVGRSNGLHDDSDVELSTRTADDGMSAAQSRLLQGNAYLLIVSVLWGSYTPALRALFTLPGAPAPIAVAAGRGILQATLLGLAVAFTAGRTSSSRPEPTADAKARPGSLSLLIQGSCEIGVYNTIGTLLQTWGLSVSLPFPTHWQCKPLPLRVLNRLFHLVAIFPLLLFQGFSRYAFQHPSLPNPTLAAERIH